MFYFRFNTEGFIAPQTTVKVTKYCDGKPISHSNEEIHTISLVEIIQYFFNKLSNELSISNICGQNALFDVIGIPMDSYGIDDELEKNIESAFKYVLLKYQKEAIFELDNKSLDDLGVKIEFCSKIANSIIEDKIEVYNKENNFSYLTESVLWKNMNQKEKIDEYVRWLDKIESKGNELIIIDPYLLKSCENEYCDLLAEIIGKASANKLIIITDKKNYQMESYDKVFKNYQGSIDIRYTSEFHDRFWISNRKKGFYTGTSLNGVGKRISLINMITSDDVCEIVKELVDNNILES